MVRAVLFDFAGTMFAPRPALECVTIAAQEAAITLDNPEALTRAYEDAGLPGGRYPDAIPAHLADVYAVRDSGPEAHERAYVGLLRTVPEPTPGFARRVYLQIRSPKGWIPYADTHQVVAALVDQGVRVGVVSNIGFDLRPILREHGLADLAAACVLSFEQGTTKPDPAIFAAALQLLGTAPQETLMVGDHEQADGGAAALGMPTLILPMTPPGSTHGLERVLVASHA